MATERVSLCDMFAADGLRRSHVQWGGSISNPMMFVRTIYWLRACVLGLFVVAQVTGVIPLIYDHTLNVYETAPVAAHGHHHVKPTAANPDADHHHGVLDLHDQCCALHTLAGPLPHVIDAAPVDFASVRMVPDQLIALTGGSPGVLDRPPRPVPLS
jgi:hypothetical protein